MNRIVHAGALALWGAVVAAPANAIALDGADGTAAQAPAPAAPESAPDAIAVASAPEAEPLPSQSGTADAAQRLEDVIVTATKREKSAREIPVSITAIKGEDLEKIGARNIKDYLMLAPGITMDEGAMGEAAGRHLTVRGIGPGTGDLGNQTVGQFIGDVALTDPYSNYGAPDLDPFDLKTVEVLRGPQGTTFGASALSGAIRYVPNAPEPGRWGVHGFVSRASVADGGTGQTRALALNAPMGDEAALRTTGVLQDIPGVIDNLQRRTPDADSGRKWSLRSAWLWEPTERLSINLMGLKQSLHKNDVLAADVGGGELTNDHLPGDAGSLDFDFGLANLDVRYSLDDWGTLVFQDSYQTKRTAIEYNADFVAPGQMGIELTRGTTSVATSGDSQELRLVSPDGGRWDWIVGVFRRNHTADVSAGLDVRRIHDVVVSTVQPLKAEETAFYGELTRRFGEHWEATAGVRRYSTRLSGVFNQIVLRAVSTDTTPIDQGESGINPKFSLACKLNRDLMAYVTVARGFQFGGVNALPFENLIPVDNPVTGKPVPVSYGSSVLWNREIGVRTDWLDRTLRADVAFYDIQWDKAQVQEQSGGIVSSGYIVNVGSVSSRGVEASFSWLTPLPGLSVNVAATYVDAHTSAPYGDVPEGTDLPAVPHVQTATTLAYNTVLGPWLGAASLTYAQWGPAYNDLQHSATIYDFGTLGLNLDVARPDWPLMPTLAVGVSNLMDERGLVGRGVGTGAASATGANTWTYTSPRTLTLRITADFN